MGLNEKIVKIKIEKLQLQNYIYGPVFGLN